MAGTQHTLKVNGEELRMIEAALTEQIALRKEAYNSGDIKTAERVKHSEHTRRLTALLSDIRA